MVIMSVSLDEGLLKEIDFLQSQSGNVGRSELVRLGIRKLISEKKDLAALKGKIDCVLLVLHSHSSTPEVSKIRHSHEALIQTQLHNHVGNEKCLEIIVASGDGSKVRRMVDDFEACKKVDYVKLVVP